MTNAEYNRYIAAKVPKSPLGKNLVKAFIFGGLICCVGQAILNLYTGRFKMEAQDASTATSITLVFLAALFTGLGLYDKLARHAGAGSLVPITGFSNSMVAAALEFKSEGLITGMSTKVFTIAGPVLVFGISASVIVGIVYYIIR